MPYFFIKMIANSQKVKYNKKYRKRSKNQKTRLVGGMFE
ncbi:MAG: hypothetical protein K0Q53_2608 [Massilibacillus sp.]|nr:hypothetical protein [Massilibacillus sp.]